MGEPHLGHANSLERLSADSSVTSRTISHQSGEAPLRGKIVGTPAYKSMTIRSWQTTMALLERMEAPEAEA